MNQIVFLKPGIFWALLFIGIILLIHFLKRPSTVHLEFSTLRFFTSQALKSKKSRSINRILLLLARCLLVAVIVLIFTRPYRKNDPFSMINDQLTKVKIWIDQSPSMSYLDDNNRSTLQAAFEIVDSLKHSVTYPSNITVYNHKRRDFLPAADNNEFNLEVIHGASFCDAFAKANVENQIEKTVFIVISDFQDPLAQTIDSLLKIDSLRCNIICLPLIPPEPYNYFLNDARLNSGADHVVSCKVHSSGRALVNGVVSVSFGGLKTGSTEVNVDADRIFEVNVSGKTHQPTSSGTVQLLTKDPLLFDNYAFFTLNNQSSLRIMIVGDVKKNFVLSAALKNTGMNNTTILLREGNEITYDELDSADVIFVNELDNYSEPLEAYLKGHTDGNKLIVFCLGTDDNVFGYEISVLSKIFKNNISREFSNRPLFPVLPDTVSELWRGFQSKFCTDVSIYNYCRNIPGEPVLKLKNGSTLISRLKDPDGCVWIVAASSFGITPDNNICETSFFVPLLDRLISSQSRAYQNISDPWIAGLPHRNPFFSLGKTVLVFSEEDKLLYTWKDLHQVTIEKPGIYKVSPQGQAAVSIVVQSDPAESIMRFSSPEPVDNPQGKVQVIQKEKFFNYLFDANRSILSILPWVLTGLLLLFEVFLWERKRVK